MKKKRKKDRNKTGKWAPILTRQDTPLDLA